MVFALERFVIRSHCKPGVTASFLWLYCTRWATFRDFLAQFFSPGTTLQDCWRWHDGHCSRLCHFLIFYLFGPRDDYIICSRIFILYVITIIIVYRLGPMLRLSVFNVSRFEMTIQCLLLQVFTCLSRHICERYICFPPVVRLFVAFVFHYTSRIYNL